LPLYEHAIDLIRANLEQLAKGNKVRPVAIGTLTEMQLAAINHSRQFRSNPMPPVIAEVLFIGQHIYNSRVVRDGYSLEDVIEQIASAMDSAAVFIPTSRAAAIQNHIARRDAYGNSVQDMAIFECTARHPRPELFSIVPKGDRPPKGSRSGQ
jgi:hypothetical protein